MTETELEYQFCFNCNDRKQCYIKPKYCTRIQEEISETTNEEYMRTCSTEELITLIVCKLRNTDLHSMRIKYNLFNGNDFDAVRAWLKEKHEE